MAALKKSIDAPAERAPAKAKPKATPKKPAARKRA